jgi:hypothetical protein
VIVDLGAGAIGFDRAGCDAVDANAMRAKLMRGDLGQLLDAAFGRDVIDKPGETAP